MSLMFRHFASDCQRTQIQNMDIAKLIALVKERPNLYENNSVRFLLERKQLWKEIAEELNVSVACCRDRWTSLRKLYRSYRIKIQRSSEIVSTYKHAEQLAFLDPHLRLQTSSEDQEEVVIRSADTESDSCDSFGRNSVEHSEKTSTREETETGVEFCLGLVPILERLRWMEDLKKNEIKLDIFQAVVSIVKESFE